MKTELACKTNLVYHNFLTDAKIAHMQYLKKIMTIMLMQMSVQLHTSNQSSESTTSIVQVLESKLEFNVMKSM